MAMIDYEAYKVVKSQRDELFVALEVLCKDIDMLDGRVEYKDIKEAMAIVAKVKKEG